MALLDVIISMSRATCLLARGERLQCFRQRLFMINSDSSVFCYHLARLLLHMWAMRSSYWLLLSPTLHFVRVSGSLRRQAGEAVIQSEVLRISPGSSSFSNYPPGGILAVLDNNGSPGVRLSPLKCGWRKPTRGAGQRNVCFSVMSSEEHKSEANLYCSAERARKWVTTTLSLWCLSM